MARRMNRESLPKREETARKPERHLIHPLKRSVFHIKDAGIILAAQQFLRDYTAAVRMPLS